jgi:hypothetical protein
MIEELDNNTDKLVRHTLVQLLRKVPWGPKRETLVSEAARFHNEKLATKAKLDDLRQKNFYSLTSGDDAVDPEQIKKLRVAFDEFGWRSELYSLAAAARYPSDEDKTVERFAQAIIEDIREFKRDGFNERTVALRDISRIVSDYLEAEGLELSDVVLPPTIHELIDAGAERPTHIDEERWDRALEAYYHQMTLDNTPADFINGGYDYDEPELQASM